MLCLRVIEKFSCLLFRYWLTTRQADIALNKPGSIFLLNSSVPPGNVNAAVCNMAATSSFAPPKLADFILTERLGRGTYATVYKAYRKVSSGDAAALTCCFFKYQSENSSNLVGGQQGSCGHKGGREEDTQ